MSAGSDVIVLPLADRELAEFLERTSRTFALAIPLLDEPLRREVGLAYLLLRVADTLEDAAPWSREERRAALAELESLSREEGRPSSLATSRGWVDRRPTGDAGSLALLARTPALLASLDALRPEAGTVVRHFALRTVRGMREVLAGASEEGGVTLGSLQALRNYCNAVAGLVGELLTELFLLDSHLSPWAPQLRALAPVFGEALQLMNMLQDATQDAEGGRAWLPRSVRLGDVQALASEDLVGAARYVRGLHAAGASRGVLAFTVLQLLLARSTLDLLARDGAGAKMSRQDVAARMRELQSALERGALPDAVEALARGG